MDGVEVRTDLLVVEWAGRGALEHKLPNFGCAFSMLLPPPHGRFPCLTVESDPILVHIL